MKELDEAKWEIAKVLAGQETITREHWNLATEILNLKGDGWKIAIVSTNQFVIYTVKKPKVIWEGDEDEKSL